MRIAAKEAVMKLARVPATRARILRRVTVLLLEGASAPIPPIIMAMEPKFANPHRA